MTNGPEKDRVPLRKHPLIRLIVASVVACATIIGTTWAFCVQIRVRPVEQQRDWCDSQLQLKVSELAAKEVFYGDQLASQAAGFREQENTIKRLLDELTVARTEQPADADQVLAIEVTLFTTRDDKDDQDVVTIEVWDGQRIVAIQQAWAGVKLDNNSTHTVSLAMPPRTQFNDRWELKVRKSGTDGWIFHVAVIGTFGDGRRVEILPRTGELHFEDQPDAVATFQLHR